MEEKKEPVPVAVTETIRLQIMDHLEREPAGVRDLSQALSVTEREILSHLEHIRRTLHHQGRTLAIRPAACRQCGFVFSKRDRFAKPGKCPVCRGTSIAPPQFSIK